MLMFLKINEYGCRQAVFPVTRLTINREAGCGAPDAVWECVELAGVARLVLGPDRLDGQLGVSQGSAQTHTLLEHLFYDLVAMFIVGGHGGGVTLLGYLCPQHLVHPLREAVPAGEGGRLTAHSRLVAIQTHFTCDKGNVCIIYIITWMCVSCMLAVSVNGFFLLALNVQ